MLMAGGLIAAAPLAGAGCVYGGARYQQVQQARPARRHLATLRGDSQLGGQRRQFLPCAREAMRRGGPRGSRPPHRRLSRRSAGSALSEPSDTGSTGPYATRTGVHWPFSEAGRHSVNAYSAIPSAAVFPVAPPGMAKKRRRT